MRDGNWISWVGNRRKVGCGARPIVQTPTVLGEAASLIDRRRRRRVLPAVSRGRGSATARVAGKGAGGLHPGSAMNRVGATNSRVGGEGGGVCAFAYGAISRRGWLFLGFSRWEVGEDRTRRLRCR